MGMRTTQTGSVLIMVVFVVALISALVMGMLQINTEEIQLVQNYIHAAEAEAVAQAGLNDALAQLRADAGWQAGFANKPFVTGTYTVAVDGSTITATGVIPRGFSARIAADVVVSRNGPPYRVAIRTLRVNP